MTKPITPKEAVNLGNDFPYEVIEAFNELIVEGRGTVRQSAVVDRIMAKMPDIRRETIFKKGWLNIEGVYTKAGWTVEYDKPGYNEFYEAHWMFTS